MESSAGRADRNGVNRPATILLFGPILHAGCAPEPVPRLVEPRPVDAALDAVEVRRSVRLAAALPGSAAAVCGEAFAVPRHWGGDRTRPVADLAAERLDELHAASAAPRAAGVLAADPGASRVLAAAHWSAERYASTLVLLNLAAARPTWDDRDLSRFAAEAADARATLAADRRPFRTLPESDRAAVLERAAWLARGVLVDRLRSLDPRTVDAVAEAGDAVRNVLPAETRRPLDRLLTDLQRRGVPFEEPDPSRDDATLVFPP